MSSADTTSTATPAMEMQGVSLGTFHDPTVEVARDVNWSVQPGDYWVIGGLHGSGKSDFLMLAAGLMSPTGGDYRLFGETMPIYDEDRLAQRLRVALVFDGGHLFNQLSVAENIALPLRYRDNLSMESAQAQLLPLLESLDLTRWADSLPTSLGHGMQKRVLLARSLILRPDVLLLDTPMSGLDLRQANWWLDFLDRLSQGKTTLTDKPMTLVVTVSDFRPWRGHARQFAVLEGQKFLVLGDWEKLSSAGSDSVRELTAAELSTS